MWFEILWVWKDEGQMLDSLGGRSTLVSEVFMESRQSEVVTLVRRRIWEIRSSTHPADNRASASWSQHSSIVSHICARPWTQQTSDLSHTSRKKTSKNDKNTQENNTNFNGYIYIYIHIHTYTELGRLLTNCNPLLIPNYMTKLVVSNIIH